MEHETAQSLEQVSIDMPQVRVVIEVVIWWDVSIASTES